VSAPPSDRVVLRPLHPDDESAFLELVAASRSLHHPWVRPPGDSIEFHELVARTDRDDFRSLLGWRPSDGGLVGVVNFSQISRGLFQSCYCGFYANAVYAGHGLMTETLRLSLRHAFTSERLHRIEANVQPSNQRSLALVRRLGFRHEGFSPRYLKINGRWRDHERFAMTVEDWHDRQ
jgi:ribosomal-protein-alanine N-acetyltransferase